MGKIQINYKSDFKLFEERDGGKGFDVPFVFRYSTLAGFGYECSHVDGRGCGLVAAGHGRRGDGAGANAK